MELEKIFDVFSRRNRYPDPYSYIIPNTVRNKILLLCRDTFSGKGNDWAGDYLQEFWNDIHDALCYRHGRLQLYDKYSNSKYADAGNFLLNCKDEEFLDFIEYIFKVKCIWRFDSDAIVDGINMIFASENVGYELTHPIREEKTESGNYMIHSPHKVITIIMYPKVLRKDSEVVHSDVIKPALQLIGDPKYKSANDEYLNALEDYRKGEYRDCLTKCCAAFESVMKIICEKKGWAYSQTDSAGSLVTILIKNLKIEPFFEPMLMIIATLRNRLSTSHGAGTKPKEVSQNLARYSLNMTASTILFLIAEAKL
jgi:hypothetical protein